MIQPVLAGEDLLRQIDRAAAPTPTLWWLGQSGFVLKYHDIIFYIDPYLSDHLAATVADPERPRTRMTASPLEPGRVRHADMLLSTHAHGSHMDPATLAPMLAASPRAKLVLPRSAAAQARAAGIDYARMTTTDSDLRVEFFRRGLYARIYAVPSAHEELDYTAAGGYPYLGYLIRCGGSTIYHAGDGVRYESLVSRLRPYNVTVALVPINGRDPRRGVAGNFDIIEAAQLAEDIGARWLVAMHYDMFAFSTADINRFIDHMLGSRPAQRFKIFQCGEGWTVPES